MRASLVALKQALLSGPAVLGQASGKVAQALPALQAAQRSLSSTAAAESSGSNKTAHYASALMGLAAGVAGASFAVSADEADHGLHAPDYPWSHTGMLDAFDHGSIRRGFQVYKQVCAACHSMIYIHWRDLVGVCYTEEEAKKMAAEEEVEDGPNDEGEMFTRPGKLSDALPNPYKNEQAARFANGGAYPPDLSNIVGARPNGTNYIFALLTGYREPPAGIKVRQGLYYNPYFPGGAIAMPKMLVDGGVDYDDGTPSNASQQAKDVVTFLTWASYPEQDERKLMGVKGMLVFTALILLASYSKRFKWATLKSRRIVSDVVN